MGLMTLTANAQSLTTSTGTYANWGGFDLLANGVWVFEGYDNSNPASQNFTATLWATAITVHNQGGGTSGANAGLIAQQYEYTTQLQMNFTAVATATSGGFNTALNVTMNSGSLSMWYDTNVNANPSTGIGITDGDLLLTGDLSLAFGFFNVITGSFPIGSVDLNGTATYTNNAYINPNLAEFRIASTIQTLADPVSGMPAVNGGNQLIPPGSLLYTSDGDFTVAAVPEASTLTLGLVGALGLLRRRR